MVATDEYSKQTLCVAVTALVNWLKKTTYVPT
jgi:hypothetical protein